MQEQFHYTLPDGHQLTLPRFDQVSVGTIRRARKLPAADQAFTILEEIITSKEDWEHLDALSSGDFQDFQRAWRDASKLQLGESSASSTS